MPANRMLHKRALAGERTNALTHLEWRVWTVYEMAADDFGVMRCHEEAWITAHPCLGKEKPRALRAAIERVVNSTLIGRFTASNGLAYVYQRDWQDWQRIEWPSMTTLPKVPDGFLESCSELTRRLFTVWPGGQRIKTKNTSDLPSDLPSQNGSESGSGLPLRANTNTHTNTNGSGSSGGAGGIGDTPERRLWEAWRVKSRVIGGIEEPAEPKHLEQMKVIEACQKVPDESVRMRALDAFWTLDERERRRLNIANRKLGYFVMALGELVAVESEEAVGARFLAGGGR